MPDPAAARWVRAAAAGAVPRLSPALASQFAALDEPALLRIAATHRVAPWLVAAIDAIPGVVPIDRSAGLRALALSERALARTNYRELAWLLGQCEQRSIATIVLKGPAVAERYYPHASLRPYSDVDLLVRERDEATITDLLRNRGFQPYQPDTGARRHHDHSRFQQIYWLPNGCIVEVHVDHLQLGLRPLDLEAVWARALPTTFDGRPTRVLEPNDLFLQLCVHLQRHGFSRLIWFKDLDLMLRAGPGAELDWDAVRARAAREGCTDAVAYTLVLLRDVLGTPLPPPAQRMLAARSLAARVVQRIAWPPVRVLALNDQRAWRLRRLTQFAPETGLLRGGLPAFFTWGRRGAKLRVLAAVARRRHPPA